MSKEQPHELQEQQQQQPHQLSPDQYQQQQYQQQQPVPTQDAAAEHHPPSYEQSNAAPVGQPPANAAPGQTARKVVPLHQLADTPQSVDCPFCHKRTKTVVKKEGGSMQFIVGGVLCLVCICLTCLPCMLHWFEDTDWFCSECNNKIAMRRNEGAIQVLGPTQVVASQYGQEQQMQNPQQQQQQPQVAPSQNVQQAGLQHADVSQHEIQSQPLQTQTQPPADVKN
ncbi:LPS-induced tumor necrosis factor alpha factor [Cordyceps militaris]|uniref:LPS-induced tumor necrosis factor alpha factor n=1 Tax=Cordyceps militaris TaxID=73501 RepID=A0A2H4SGN7_CORMI|nr:LPS-induced tumor necrosis factor alpha factor [Cordyceps militaris]